MNDTKQPTCEGRIDSELESRVADMKDIRARQNSDDNEVSEEAHEEHNEWPLSVDLKRIVTIQVSWGGPSDEFRCEVDDDGKIEAIEYRFMNWFDGASREVTDDEVFDFLQDYVDLQLGTY